MHVLQDSDVECLILMTSSYHILLSFLPSTLNKFESYLYNLFPLIYIFFTSIYNFKKNWNIVKGVILKKTYTAVCSVC